MKTIYRGAILVLILGALTACQRPAQVLLETPLGTLRGDDLGTAHRFLGIPYAETTAGENRWKPPIPVHPWEGVRDANEFGPWCPQFDFERRDEGEVHSGPGWTVFRNVPPNLESSEDCLSLNVWTPAGDGGPYPVMVFLHGNALGSSFPLFDGASFAQNGIVFVSVNYRLHTMGNFAHPALTAEASPDEPLGRYAELDRLEALRWVQRNIAAFGGSPNHVTLAGQSEGGAATLQLLGNNDAKGLFHQAIVQSGNGWWSPPSQEPHEALGCMLATLSGLQGCSASAEDLRGLDWSAIPATGPYTIDGRYWTRGATEAIEQGDILDVPLLIGWNDFDGSSLRYPPQEVIDKTHPEVLAAYETDASAEDLAYEIYTDLHSGAPARWVAKQTEHGAPTFLYLFSYIISWERGEQRGATHAYELPHAFDTFDDQLDAMFPWLSQLLLSEEDNRMTEIMHSCWVSFVKTGQPQCDGAPEWPRYARKSDLVMELTNPPRVVSGYRAQRLDAQEGGRAHYFEQARESFRLLLRDGLRPKP